MKLILLLSSFLILTKSLYAETPQQVEIFTLTDMNTWGNPKLLPPGAHDLVLEGSSSAQGIYTIRLKLPANYKIPPYIQTAPTYITVITGSYNVAEGTVFDVTKGKSIPQGGFIIIPANTAVYTWTTEPTIIQMHGEGPLQIKLVPKSL